MLNPLTVYAGTTRIYFENARSASIFPSLPNSNGVFIACRTTIKRKKRANDEGVGKPLVAFWVAYQPPDRIFFILRGAAGEKVLLMAHKNAYPLLLFIYVSAINNKWRTLWKIYNKYYTIWHHPCKLYTFNNARIEEKLNYLWKFSSCTLLEPPS